MYNLLFIGRAAMKTYRTGGGKTMASGQQEVTDGASAAEQAKGMRAAGRIPARDWTEEH